jgi:hypothetical protein
MGCIFLITSFDPTGIIKILKGSVGGEDIEGFESKWYFLTGTKLCTSLVLSAIATNMTEFKRVFFALFSRCIDRNGKLTI